MGWDQKWVCGVIGPELPSSPLCSELRNMQPCRQSLSSVVATLVSVSCKTPG